jgi:hypothetical protein
MTDRPRYREGQRLDVEVLESEQDYLVEGRRQHDLTGHGPGIVHGLGLSTVAAGVLVAPGVAVDDAGRTLVVPRVIRLPWKDLPAGAAGLDLWLSYQETTTADRVGEGVCVRVQRVETAAAVSSPADSLIALGRLERDDSGVPPYVPVPVPLSYPDAVAGSVEARPGVAMRLGAEPLFALDAPGPVRRLAVGTRATEVVGTLSVPAGRVGGPVRFERPVPVPEQAFPWRWYRVDGPRLRVELAAPAGTEMPEWYRFTVKTCRDSTRRAGAAGATTTVRGDLTVRGALVRAAAGGDPDDPRLREELLGTWVDAVDVASRAVDARFRGPAVEAGTMSITLVPGAAAGSPLPYRVLLVNDGSSLITGISLVLTTTVDGVTADPVTTDGLQLAPSQTRTLDESVVLPSLGSMVHVSAAALGVLPGNRIAYASGVLDYEGTIIH